MRVIKAPNDYERQRHDVICFLAGGITDCPDWQTEVVESLLRMERNDIDLSQLVIMNPRRENFPINDPSANEEQIQWEFKWLEECDIFSMYFAPGESVQPICMYELGRNILRMQQKYMVSWQDHLVISVADGYKRSKDVLVQANLAIGRDIVPEHVTPQDHAHAILMAYTWATDGM